MHFYKRYQIISSFMPKICISDQSKQNLWEVIQKWPLTSLLVKEVNRKSLRVLWKWFHEKKRKIRKKLVKITSHSPCEILVQVMKSTRGFPLTPGRWDHMWMKNGVFKIFCPGYLTNKFSKTKTVPIGPHFSIVFSNIFVSISMQYTFLMKN